MRWFKTLFGGAANRVSLAPAEQEMIENWRRLPAADLSVMHEEQRYVVVDVETSGLNMKKDRLISIGAVALVAGRLDFNDAFQVVLRQEQVSTHANILIHGISGSAQSAGVDPVAGLLAFLQYVGKSPLVAYHAFFDQSMIGKATREYLGMELAQPWIDLAWVLPDFFSFRGDANVALDDWLHHFGIESILRHNAVSDAYATAKLLQVAIAGGQQKGATSPVAFIRIEKARRWMQECR